MSNENNIQNFDNFFRESFGNFQPEPPAGVFEAIQSQLGASAAGGATGATIATKAGAWALGKIIVGSIAAVAVATTVYIAVNNSSNNNPVSPTAQQVQNQNRSDASIQNNTITDNTAIASGDATAAANIAENNGVTTIPGNTSQNGGTNNGTGANNPSPANTTNSTGNNPQVQPATTPGDMGQPNKPGPVTPNNTPEKTMVGLYISDTRACANDVVTITIADDLSKTTYRVNFGDGNTAVSKPGKPITHTYKTPGSYKIMANDIEGNKATSVQTLNVYGVKAAFTAQNIEKATFRFINNSQGALHYDWFFGDNSEMVQEASPIHTYNSFEAAEYKVKLIAINEAGCIDSFIVRVKQAYTYEEMKPIIPNVFTPNNDGMNDEYEIGIRNEEKYHLVIMDRAGNKVFESTSKEDTWNGRNKFTGDECAAAIYRMEFLYKIKGFTEQKVTGLVEIKR